VARGEERDKLGRSIVDGAMLKAVVPAPSSQGLVEISALLIDLLRSTK
jgi:hypothetical protein